LTPGGSLGAITGPLKLGSSGPDVSAVQRTLNSKLIPSPGLNPDGILGLKTDAAIRSFQKTRSLVVDGIVGPKTAGALGFRYIARAPLPPPAPPRQRPSLDIPEAPGNPSSNVIAEIIEGVVEGFAAIRTRLLALLDDLEALPDLILDQIRSAIKTAFQNAISHVRNIASAAFRAGAAAKNVIAGGIRTAFSLISNAIRGIADKIASLGLGVFSAVVNTLRKMVTKLFSTAEAVADTIRRVLEGAYQATVAAATAEIAAVISAAAELVG
jgi:hypothetical protein